MNQHFKQIVSVRFAVGPTAATADHMLQVGPVYEQTTRFHKAGILVVQILTSWNLLKTFSHNIKIQSKFMYGETNCFRVVAAAIAGRACSLAHH